LLHFIATNPIASGVIASALFALLWQAFGYMSGYVRTPFDLVATLAGGGVVRKFPSMNAARRWLRPVVSNTRTLKFLAVRGFPMTQETYALHEILVECYNPRKHSHIQILLIDPEQPEARKRAEEYMKLAFESVDTYLYQIRDSINTLLDMKRSFPTLELRLYNSPVLARVLICDKACFIGFYTDKLIGATSPVLMVNSPGLLYAYFDRYFDTLWANSKEVVEKFV
jgi:hypothetical protein